MKIQSVFISLYCNKLPMKYIDNYYGVQCLKFKWYWQMRVQIKKVGLEMKELDGVIGAMRLR